VKVENPTPTEDNPPSSSLQSREEGTARRPRAGRRRGREEERKDCTTAKFSEEQLEMLEYAYRAKKKPGSVAMRELAELAGITFLQCKSWFQYQRKKKKRREEENEANALKAEISLMSEQIREKQAKNDGLQKRNADLHKLADTLQQYTHEVQACVQLLSENIQREEEADALARLQANVLRSVRDDGPLNSGSSLTLSLPPSSLNPTTQI